LDNSTARGAWLPFAGKFRCNFDGFGTKGAFEFDDGFTGGISGPPLFGEHVLDCGIDGWRFGLWVWLGGGFYSGTLDGVL
jgi:hypothetical protein